MVEFSEKTLEQLTSIYLYANTPSYLYEKVRALPEIEQLGYADRIAEVEATIKQLLDHVEHPNDLLTLYGLIVSLSFSCSAQILRILQELSQSDLDWVGRLAKHINDALIPSTVMDLRHKMPRTSSPLILTSSGSVSRIHFSLSPEIKTKEL